VGDPAHTATHGVNLRIEGRALPLMGLTCALKGAHCHFSGEPCRQMYPRASPQTQRRVALRA